MYAQCWGSLRFSYKIYKTNTHDKGDADISPYVYACSTCLRQTTCGRCRLFAKPPAKDVRIRSGVKPELKDDGIPKVWSYAFVEVGSKSVDGFENLFNNIVVYNML